MGDVDRIAKKIMQARQQLLDAIQGLTEEEMAQPFNAEWSIREILHHVAIGEQANLEIAERALIGDPITIEGFDMDAWNVEQVAQQAGRPTSEAIAALQHVRQKTLSLLRSLSAEDLAVKLNHPGWGEMTVAQLFRALGIHDLMHRRDILRRVEHLRTNS